MKPKTNVFEQNDTAEHV